MSKFENPDLMVIGDSLPQGCRSLSVTRTFCAMSYPAQLAALGGLKFNTPQHPRPILFDLEEIAGDLIFAGLPAYFGGIAENYADWLAAFSADRAKGPVFFDNLAVAGFTLEDTLGEQLQQNGKPAMGTASLAAAWLAKTPALDVKKQFGLVSDLHTAVNARYVLNPGNESEFAGFSQVDWVLRRKPKVLIVHIGHNNGLYAIGSRGDLLDWNANWSPAQGGLALAKYKILIDRLSRGLPATRIVFVGLPKVSAVANLMPLGPARLAQDIEYFARYETQFPFRVPVEGSVIKSADQEITRVNTEIRTAVAAANATHGSLHYFDAYGFFQRLDVKNLGETPVRVGTRTFDNFYIKGDFRRQPGGKPGAPGRFKWEFEQGGLQSLDGMHPTTIGYALLAFELLPIVTGKSLSATQRDRHLDRVVRQERLISPFPQGLASIQTILSKVDHPNQTGDETAFNQTIQNTVYVTS